jgi:ribosomal protein S25
MKIRRTQSEVEAMRKRIVDTIRRTPMSKTMLAQEMHIGKGAAERYLDHLRQRGRLVNVRCPVNGWLILCVPEAAKALTAAYDARRNLRTEKRKAKDQRRKERLRDLTPMAEDDGIEIMPVNQRWVSAAAVQIVKLGPASVWELSA